LSFRLCRRDRQDFGESNRRVGGGWSGRKRRRTSFAILKIASFSLGNRGRKRRRTSFAILKIASFSLGNSGRKRRRTSGRDSKNSSAFLLGNPGRDSKAKRFRRDAEVVEERNALEVERTRSLLKNERF